MIHLENAEREKCEKLSEVSPNTICTQEKEQGNVECNVSHCIWAHCILSIFHLFFYVGPPKEDIFFDHLLWSIFQSTGTYILQITII